MIRPDIKTYHEDRRRHWFTTDTKRRHFHGQSALDLQWQKEPEANLKMKDNLFELEVAMPGYSKEEIQVSLFNDVLTVKAIKEKEESPTQMYIAKEFDVDMMERKFILAEGIEQGNIEAEYENGILKVVFSDIKEKPFQSKKKISVR